MEEPGEDEEVGSVHSSDSKKEGSYRVVGTLKDPTSKPAPYVAEIINVSNCAKYCMYSSTMRTLNF